MSTLATFLFCFALLFDQCPGVTLLGAGTCKSGGGGGSNTWTLVQHQHATCSASPCAITVTSTGSNNALFAVAETINNVTISSMTSAACSATWQHPGANAFEASAGGIDADYCLQSASGQTSISFTFSGAPGSGGEVFIAEYTPSTGTSTFDTSGSGTNGNTQSTPVPGVALTLTGTSDVICQGMIPSTTATGISGGAFASPDFTDTTGGFGFSCAKNTSNGAAPSWSVNATAFNAVTAVALK